MRTKTKAYANRPSIIITGFLLYRGESRLINIEQSRLMLDVRAYSLHIATYIEDRAERFNAESNTSEMLKHAKMLREWVANPRGTVTHELEFLVPRQEWLPHTIRRSDLDDYCLKIIGASRKELAMQPVWMLNADLVVPEIWVHRRYREICWFSGPDVLGYSISRQSKLRDIINEHIRHQAIDAGEWRQGSDGASPNE